MTPEDLLRKEEEEKKRLAKLERQKHERRCPKCDMKAFPEDSVKLSDTFFHKALKFINLEQNELDILNVFRPA